MRRSGNSASSHSLAPALHVALTKYREGRLGSRATAKLLPVAITEERLAEAEKVGGVPVPPAPLGIIEMVLPKGKLRIEGRVELVTLLAAIECLL